MLLALPSGSFIHEKAGFSRVRIGQQSKDSTKNLILVMPDGEPVLSYRKIYGPGQLEIEEHLWDQVFSHMGQMLPTEYDGPDIDKAKEELRQILQAAFDALT